MKAPNWAEAKSAFIGGESAVAIAQRLELSLPALRRRISRNGWVRERDEGPQVEKPLPVHGENVRRVCAMELDTLSRRLATIKPSRNIRDLHEQVVLLSQFVAGASLVFSWNAHHAAGPKDSELLKVV